jgi:nitrogen regulatory protein PII
MQLHPLKLVTVIAEPVIEEPIAQKALELGATGYTSSSVSGSGARGIRNSTTLSENVQMQFVVSEEVAGELLTYISRKYFEHYACIAWVTDVSVVRGNRYIREK